MRKVCMQCNAVAAILSTLALALHSKLSVPLLHPRVTDPGTGIGMKIRPNDEFWHAACNRKAAGPGQGQGCPDPICADISLADSVT